MKRMHSLLAILAMLALSLPLVRVPSAHAMPFNTTACDGMLGIGCFAGTQWSGINTHGARSDFIIDNPGNGSLQYYKKYISITTSTGAVANVGEVNGTEPCVTGGLQFFWETINSNNDNHHCAPVPADDINNYAVIRISYFVSNGGGVFFYETGDTNNNVNDLALCNPNPCSQKNSSFTNTFTQSNQSILGGFTSFGAHEIWGGAWVNNQYYTGTQWNYDATTPTITTENNNGASGQHPPQMYYPTTSDQPNGATNHGGTLYSCVYPSGTTCTLGS